MSKSLVGSSKIGHWNKHCEIFRTFAVGLSLAIDYPRFNKLSGISLSTTVCTINVWIWKLTMKNANSARTSFCWCWCLIGFVLSWIRLFVARLLTLWLVLGRLYIIRVALFDFFLVEMLQLWVCTVKSAVGFTDQLENLGHNHNLAFWHATAKRLWYELSSVRPSVYHGCILAKRRELEHMNCCWSLIWYCIPSTPV